MRGKHCLTTNQLFLNCHTLCLCPQSPYGRNWTRGKAGRTKRGSARDGERGKSQLPSKRLFSAEGCGRPDVSLEVHATSDQEGLWIYKLTVQSSVSCQERDYVVTGRREASQRQTTTIDCELLWQENLCDDDASLTKTTFFPFHES